MWVLIYITRTVTHDKALSQRLHGNGFSSVWVIGCFQNIDSGVSQCVVPCVDTGSFLNNGQIVTKLSIRTHCRGTGCSVYIRVFTPACALWCIWCWRESFITTAALNWCLSSLSSLMHYKNICPRESLITKDALEWFLPSMCSMMYHNGFIEMVPLQYEFSYALQEKALSQRIHWNGFSPVWVLLATSVKSWLSNVI